MARRGMANVEAKIFPIEVLREFSTRVFLHFGVPKTDAAQAADVLASADLRGIDSHGVARLTSYFDLLRERLINPTPKIKILRSTPSTATLHGGNRLRLVVGPQANEIPMRMAEKAGSRWVSIATTDPEAMFAGGACSPLAADGARRSNKSHGLVIMADVLSGVLRGANWGRSPPPSALRREVPARSVGTGIGLAFAALRIIGFT